MCAQLSRELHHSATRWQIGVLATVGTLEALCYSSLTPLLPTFQRELQLSKGEIGILAGAYPVGWVVAALPVGVLVSRMGVRRFVLVGLAGLGAATMAFAYVDSYGMLIGARLLQGIAAAVCFAAALAWLVVIFGGNRRAEMIGIYAGASAAGAMCGPAIGALGVLVGRPLAFACVGVFSILLILAVARLSGPNPSERLSLTVIRRAHRSSTLMRSQWMVFLPGLLLGVIFVLAPLQLARVGWGPVGIAVTFLSASAIGVVARPFTGRWADQRGLLDAMRLVLLASIPLTLTVPWLEEPWILATCIVGAVMTYGLLWGPAMALVSHAYEEAGIAQLFGFSLMGITNGIGLITGSVGAGMIAQLTDDTTAYTLAAGISLATVLALPIAVRAA